MYRELLYYTYSYHFCFTGKNYELQTSTIKLLPGVNQTEITILIKQRSKLDEVVIVHLTILPGYNGSLNYSTARVIVIGKEGKLILTYYIYSLKGTIIDSNLPSLQVCG